MPSGELTTLLESEPAPQPVLVAESEPAVVARPPRFPAFDGLRAIAALTVVAVHTSFIAGLTPRNPAVGRYTGRLEIGVAVFFLISGFLLYRPFVVAHLSAAPKPRTGAFWLLRILRIVPAFWLVLFIETHVLHAGPGLGPGGWTANLWHFGFAQIYSPDHVTKGISAAWSLNVEMTFYLFVPLYAALIGWRRARRSLGAQLRVELYGLLAMVIVSFAWRLAILPFQNGHSAYFRLATTWLPAQLDLFALGMFLAVASAWLHHNRREVAVFAAWGFPGAAWALAGVCFWAVSNLGIPTVPLYHQSQLDIARQTLYGLFAFFLLLPAVFGPQRKGLIRRFLLSWPMASIGVISYGIYLWHEVWIYQLLKEGRFQLFNLEFWGYFLAVVVLAIGSATISYFVVEKPALRLKNSIAWWRRPSRTAASGVPEV